MLESMAEKLTREMIEGVERARSNLKLILLLNIYCPECHAKRPLHKRGCHMYVVEDMMRQDSEREARADWTRNHKT